MTIIIVMAENAGAAEEAALAQLLAASGAADEECQRWLWPDAREGQPLAEQILPGLIARCQTQQVTHLLFAPGLLGEALAVGAAHALGGCAATDVQRFDIDGGWVERGSHANGLLARTALPAVPWCLCAAAYPGQRQLAADMVTCGLPLAPAPGWLLGQTPLATQAESPLREAQCVLALGGGVGSAQAMAQLSAGAAQVGVVTGASREAVMSGWCDMGQLIGMSGAQLAPEICVVAGVSGAPAFMQGIRHSGLIVAINHDPQAAVFAAADVGIIGDLHVVLAALWAEINSAV